MSKLVPLFTIANPASRQIMTFDYVNHNGEAARRRIYATNVWYGDSAYYKNTWHLSGVDLDRGAWRSFMLDKVENIRIEAVPV